MWQSDSPEKKGKARLPSGPVASSTSSLFKSRPALLQRALSFQFLNKEEDGLTREQRAYIKMRYKDVAKYVIWPSCRFENEEIYPNLTPIKPAPLAEKDLVPTDPRAVLFKPEMDDERSPYLPATINHVLRSDSEDSSDAEELMRVTRL